jgi:MFS family permease
VLAATGYLFYLDVLGALALTLLWCLTFFIVGAGAAAAYLVASEVWPVELRAEAFSMFYVVASTFGAVGPTVFGALIGDGSDRFPLTVGYLFGAAMIVAGGLVMWFFGVDAERRSLEDIAPPLAATGDKPNVTPGMHP